MSRQKIWDFWAHRYEKLWVQKVSLAPTRREILKSLKDLLEKDKKYRLLDVGCGIGQLLREIKAEFPNHNIELTGIDFSKEMIQRANGIGEGIDYQQLDVNNIHTLAKKFDIIICTHSFPYYEDQHQTIKSFRGLLKEGGYLLLAQASQNNFYDGITMFFVKFTTGRAKYPSVKAIQKITTNLFKTEAVIRIREKFFIPSIYFFVLKGDKL